MLSNNSLLLSSKLLPTDRVDHHPHQYIDRHDTYYPPSPPLSTSIASPHSSMSKIPSPSNAWSHTKPSKDNCNTSFLNLERVIQNYASQPELLELILASKVEEDKRRAEEAKLRRKEIDYMLQKKDAEDAPQACPKAHNQSLPSPRFEDSDKPLVLASLPPISPPNCYKARENSFSSSSSMDSLLPKMSQSFSAKYQAPSGTFEPSFSAEWKQQQSGSSSSNYLKAQSSLKRRNSSSIEMLLSPLPNPMDRKLPEPSIKSATLTDCLPKYSLNHKRLSYLETEENSDSAGSDRSLSTDSNASKRRKREMQAITTIIETKEFPYNDDYLWKNNGNTVHKKTGFKSIYYKCSNSSKGCPVNKTVTFKDNGEHLIKYRGQHLSECNRIKRIIDINK